MRKWKEYVWFLALLSLSVTVKANGQIERLPLYFGHPGKLLQGMGVDTTNNIRVKEIADNSETLGNSNACVLLAQRGEYDIVPKLRSLLYKAFRRGFAMNDSYDYLYAMYLLDRQGAAALAREALDSMKVWHSAVDDRYDERFVDDAVALLLSLGDYSRFEDLETATTVALNKGYFYGSLALEVFATRPEYRGRIFELVKAAANSSHDEAHSWAVCFLAPNFMGFPETQEMLRNAALNDRVLAIREAAIGQLFSYYNDPVTADACLKFVREFPDFEAVVSAATFLGNYWSPRAPLILKQIAEIVPPGHSREFAVWAADDYKPWDLSKNRPVMEVVDSLESFLSQVYGLGWLADENFVNELDDDLENARKHVAKGDLVSAYKEVQKFQEKIQKEYDKTQENEEKNKPQDKRFVTTEGYKFLYYNAQYILDRLPAQPQEPPFVAQIDSLSASLATAYANGWIGDRGFTNSLNKQLTDARKNLGKGNLARASAQLQNFLNRLQKVYHHTLEEQQKGKRRPKNFVTEEGFTFLAGKTTELLTKLGSLGRILSVPGQFTTIQAAVNAAEPGTTIEVDAGTYKELVEVQKKDSLTLLASEDVTIQGVRIARSSVNNVIAGNEKNGIDFADGAQYVLNNTIVKNGWNGVEAASQKNLSLVNNIISFNGTAKGDAEGRYGVKREGKAGAGKIVLLNNLIIGNNGKVNKQSSKDVANHDQVLDGADSGNITSTGAEGAGVSGSSAQSFGDVLLADYRLAESSVAIDKGTVSFAAPEAEAGKLPEEDKDGNPRPQRTSIDLGAFELE
jgi:hypothetical protein